MMIQYKPATADVLLQSISEDTYPPFKHTQTLTFGFFTYSSIMPCYCSVPPPVWCVCVYVCVCPVLHPEPGFSSHLTQCGTCSLAYQEGQSLKLQRQTVIIIKMGQGTAWRQADT